MKLTGTAGALRAEYDGPYLDDTGHVWYAAEYNLPTDLLPICGECGSHFSEGYVTSHMRRFMCAACAEVVPHSPGDAYTYHKDIGAVVDSKPPWLEEGKDACLTTTS